MTDFGAEESFYQAAKRMKEHHGVDVNPGTIRETTEKYARKASEAINRLPTRREKSDQMIIEMDGEMVPLVEYEESEDRRKTKRLLWSELRIGTVQNVGEVNWGYACSFESPEHLGQRIKAVMEKLGFYERTEVHSVGDGAKWITEQGEKLAGANFHHLIDLPHLCEYLSEAANAWTENTKDEVKKFKKELFEGGIGKVLGKLKETEMPTQHEGLRKCIQYIENRHGQFDYKNAKRKGLPIGSGKVESTHRSLIQKRLKKPGTWWLKNNAANMADLRTLRANDGWYLLWEKRSLREAA